MDSPEEMEKRISEWQKYIQELKEKQRNASDPEKRRFLSNKIRWATWKMKSIEDALWGKL